MSGSASYQRAIGCIVAGILLVICLVGLLKVLYPLRYREEIDHWAAAFSLDPYLVAAVIRAESRFRPDALSRAGARGLMQITPATGQWIAAMLRAEDYTVEDLHRPNLNIRFGTWYLRYLLDRLANDIKTALIAYNAGLSNLFRWQSEGGTVFPETEAFVTRVLRGWSAYRLIYRLPVLGHLLRRLPV